MRIVAGQYGGRRLEVPKGRDIRPTSDKVRGAIFNALRSRGAVEHARVLDAFCGTGALGLEALSQGAAHLDKSRESLELARRNAAALGLLPPLQAQTITASPAKAGVLETTTFKRSPLSRGMQNSGLPARNDEKDVEFLLKDSSKLGVCPYDPFDLVFLDPPYEKGLITPTLNILHNQNWVAREGVVVCEMEKSWRGEIPTAYETLDEKTYGDTQVMFLQTI